MSRESLADIAVRYGQFSTFGHKDYEMAKKSGYNDDEIKKWLDQDKSRLHADNRKGGSTGLYDEISANAVDLRKKVDIDRGRAAQQAKPKSGKRMAGSKEFQENLQTAKKPEVDQFKRQVNRENSVNQKLTQADSEQSSNIYNKYVNANRQAQFGRGDVSSIIDKYTFKARESNPIDVTALDKHIRRGPMYHEAKAEVAGLQTYGDKYRNSRENSKSWSQPDPMEGVEKPDFMSFYKQTKKDIDSIDI